MGDECDWNPAAPLVSTLNELDPAKVEYRAALDHHSDAEGNIQVDKWNNDWTDAMMKSSDKSGFAFNNVADSILKTRNVLLRKIGLPLPSEKKKEVVNKAA